MRRSGRVFVALSGRRHRVITAVAVKRGDKVWQSDVVSTVRMKTLSTIEVNAYLATATGKARPVAMAFRVLRRV